MSEVMGAKLFVGVCAIVVIMTVVIIGVVEETLKLHEIKTKHILCVPVLKGLSPSKPPVWKFIILLFSHSSLVSSSSHLQLCTRSRPPHTGLLLSSRVT